MERDPHLDSMIAMYIGLIEYMLIGFDIKIVFFYSRATLHLSMPWYAMFVIMYDNV